jgi:hypothetical protein
MKQALDLLGAIAAEMGEYQRRLREQTGYAVPFQTAAYCFKRWICSRCTPS